ncbi:hypothetical protein [Williamsia deligens]|uniref:Uncharacterized protein n=1 Tax=Williamsia deligens TaxID=321325 RepID=A0ABW3GD74_9NOCA|nr:hypothetical protein [Williamsia deligens]MCP2196303.1 hypothetical protein [Williamsia deligens]
MAREYAKAWFSMFTDEDFAQQSHSDRWFFMTLLAQPALNYAGVQPINMRRWRKAMRDEHGMPSEADMEKALIRLERRGHVFTDDDTGEVLIRSFIRVDEVYKQPNTLKSGLRAVAHIESPKLAAVMVDELSRIELPEIKSDKLSAEIDALHTAARRHVEALSEGITEPFAEPFTDPIADGMPEPFAEGMRRPGETDPIAEGIGEGMPEGSVVVEVEVVSPPEEVGLGGSRAHAREAGDQSQPGSDRDGPPSNAHDPEPPTRCARHASAPLDEHIPNCGPCANFRKAHERWAERQRRREAEAVSARARAHAETRQAAIDACSMCNANGYRGLQLCSHDPGQDETNRDGLKAAREALAKAQAQAKAKAGQS